MIKQPRKCDDRQRLLECSFHHLWRTSKEYSWKHIQAAPTPSEGQASTPALLSSSLLGCFNLVEFHEGIETEKV